MKNMTKEGVCMATPLQTAKPLSGRDSIPPLESGDHLTRDEFRRRYEAASTLKKAELVEGVVHMPPPVSTSGHASPHFDLIGWLGVYRAATPGVQGGDNATLWLDLDNAPQPDAFLRILPDCGGQSTTVDGYVEGAPELVAEVAATSASYDLHEKLNAYRRNGVQEYVVWRVLDQRLDWFALRDGRYERLGPDDDGIHRSEVFPGLWLAVDALLAGNVSQVHAIASEGVASAEHDQFVERIGG
jgi:Uma2 family endonuclease